MKKVIGSKIEQNYIFGFNPIWFSAIISRRLPHEIVIIVIIIEIVIKYFISNKLLISNVT